MRADVKWTNLSRRPIARRLAERGTPASRRGVAQWLHPQGYRRRKALKKATMGRPPDRDAPFANIARLTQEYREAGLPVISIDTKQKELLGHCYRPGVIDTREAILVNDHDFGSQGKGTLLPHGIYAVAKKQGYLPRNTSHDTTELACDSIALWWEGHGREDYPEAKKLLVLCDGGGSNSASKYVFQEDLQALANRLGLAIRVAHYPPSCSTYNLLEHRLFPPVTRACRGVILDTAETAKHSMEKTETSTGLGVVVRFLDKV
jgi:Rhodopirellula transposase DDE domain